MSNTLSQIRLQEFEYTAVNFSLRHTQRIHHCTPLKKNYIEAIQVSVTNQAVTTRSTVLFY